MELSKRMTMLCNMVPEGTVLCDVGCDHGFVSIELIKRHICPHIIATDVRSGPLSRAEEHVAQEGLRSEIELRLSDGLEQVKISEVDGFLAAGMGGKLILHIMEKSLVKIRKMSYMILQPQSELQEVRKYLRQKQFQILKEDMVQEEGKFYTAMLVKIHSNQQVNYKEMEEKANLILNWKEADKINRIGDKYGALLLMNGHPVLAEYLIWWEKQQKEILEKIEGHKDRVLEVRSELSDISDARKIWLMKHDFEPK